MVALATWKERHLREGTLMTSDSGGFAEAGVVQIVQDRVQPWSTPHTPRSVSPPLPSGSRILALEKGSAQEEKELMKSK